MPTLRALTIAKFMLTASALAVATVMPVVPALAADKPAPPPAGDHLKWTGWTPDLFTKAKNEKKLVILDLEAVWCHWCHVMEERTYSNRKVEGLIDAKFIPVRVDQDANPDLSSRYGDWGWPATIIFAPDGTELVKLRGFVEPDRMASLLQAVIDDPTPGPSAQAAEKVTPAKDAFLSTAQRDELKKNYDASYDTENGGWGGRLRYIDADSMDEAFALAGDGDKKAEGEARKTLDAAIALIDPVWGGVSQYSDNGKWDSPHYEKIMAFQAQYLRQYSEAYARWHDPKYLKAATAIDGYIMNFLEGQDGGFMTSQDADLDAKHSGHDYYALNDAQRRQLGIPRIDTHQYARENGWAITGLVAYYDVTNNEKVLKAAEQAADWALKNRALPGGGFSHAGKTDRGGPFLGDTLAMGQAFIALYSATGDRKWLMDAMSAGEFIGKTFEDPSGGFLPAKGAEADAASFKTAPKQLDDQIGVARFMNLLARYTGQDRYKTFASHAMRYAVGAAKDLERPLPGLLLADRELGREPTHVTVIGHKDDAAAQKLDQAARALPAGYKRLDWWDTREGPLVNPDITYPELDKAAAFACGNRTCSLPVFKPEELTDAVALMAKRDAKQHAERPSQ